MVSGFAMATESLPSYIGQKDHNFQKIVVFSNKGIVQIDALLGIWLAFKC